MITHALGALQPTAKGRALAAKPEFKRLCEQIATKVILAELPYEILESRLRAATIKILLPAREYSPDEVADFYRVHYAEVDALWRGAIEDTMRTIDSDRTGTLERAVGVRIPRA
jgi:hypothetical protein